MQTIQIQIIANMGIVQVVTNHFSPMGKAEHVQLMGYDEAEYQR